MDGTGRIAILNDQGTSTIAYAEVDLVDSSGTYYRLVDRKTGQVIGTGNKTNDVITELAEKRNHHGAANVLRAWWISLNEGVPKGRWEPSGGQPAAGNSDPLAMSMMNGPAWAGYRSTIAFLYASPSSPSSSRASSR